MNTYLTTTEVIFYIILAFVVIAAIKLTGSFILNMINNLENFLQKEKKVYQDELNLHKQDSIEESEDCLFM